MTRYHAIDWYDLPKFYDAVFAADTILEADFLQFATKRFGRPDATRVLEPACGSGRLVRELLRRGWDVTGFDANPHMIAYAQRHLPGTKGIVNLVPGRMERFRFPRTFDVAHCLVSTFKYLPTERAALGHLRCMAEHLKKGGLYVLGLHLTQYDVTTRTRERWVAPVPGGGEVVCNLQIWPADRRKRLERVRSRLRVETRGDVSRYETVWFFRTYDVSQLKRLIGKVSAFEHLATYDFSYDTRRSFELNGERLDVVLILRKR